MNNIKGPHRGKITPKSYKFDRAAYIPGHTSVKCKVTNDITIPNDSIGVIAPTQHLLRHNLFLLNNCQTLSSGTYASIEVLVGNLTANKIYISNDEEYIQLILLKKGNNE